MHVHSFAPDRVTATWGAYLWSSITLELVLYHLQFFPPNLTHLYALQYEETLNMEVTERLVQTWMASGRDEEANQIVLGML